MNICHPLGVLVTMISIGWLGSPAQVQGNQPLPIPPVPEPIQRPPRVNPTGPAGPTPTAPQAIPPAPGTQPKPGDKEPPPGEGQRPPGVNPTEPAGPTPTAPQAIPPAPGTQPKPGDKEPLPSEGQRPSGVNPPGPAGPTPTAPPAIPPAPGTQPKPGDKEPPPGEGQRPLPEADPAPTVTPNQTARGPQEIDQSPPKAEPPIFQDGCEDFGKQFEIRRSSLVTLQCSGERLFGFLFDVEGRIWLAVQASKDWSLAGNRALMQPMAMDPARTVGESIEITIQYTASLGNPRFLDLIDVTAYASVLSQAEVRPPPLIDPTGQWRRTVAGNPALTMWLEGVKAAPRVMHQVGRASSLARGEDGDLQLRLSPPLPQMSKTGPVLDRGGHLIGVVREPSDADSNEVLLIGPDQLWTATHAAPLGWRNSEGLGRTVTDLLEEGFTRLSKYRTHRLTDGLWNGTFDAPSASVAKAGIAFVAEDENHPVQLRAWRDRSECKVTTSPKDRNNKGEGEDLFSIPPEGVVMVITNPCTKDGCPLEVRSKGGDPSALLLEVNALPETEATANLPRLETLLGETRGSRSPPTPSPRGSEDALKADAHTTDDCSELPETSYTEGRKNGPIVHIPMRGTVGFCDMEEPFFTASDFTRAIRSAGASGASAIVLDIDSPGGRVDTEHEIIRELLLAQRLGYRVIANVRTAYSAAGLIAMSCKEIIVHPGAGIGAAVTWNGMESLDKMLMSDPALKAKMESPGLALQREMSEVSGHPACITGAMRFPKEQLWWSPNGGFSDKSTGAKDEILLDNETSVLTLNASEIVKYGLGYECLLPTDIPAILQLEGREEQDLEATMDCTPKQCSEILKKYGGDENAAWPELETVLRRP